MLGASRGDTVNSFHTVVIVTRAVVENLSLAGMQMDTIEAWNPCSLSHRGTHCLAKHQDEWALAVLVPPLMVELEARVLRPVELVAAVLQDWCANSVLQRWPAVACLV